MTASNGWKDLLRSASFAFVVVTHDRYFLENVATQIIELNRIYSDGLLRVKGSYSKFLEDREAYVEWQQRAQESLRNRVRVEMEWLRRGPKARTTKAKARIDNANALISELRDSESRTRIATAGITFDATGRQTKRLIEVENAAVTLGDREILRGVSVTLTNGLKLGLTGANGSGKTTLLRAITGEITLSAGEIRRAPGLRIVYFSQMRELDTSLTLRRTLAPDSDSVIYRDRVVHVAGYASRFLFTGEQLNQPVERLSGGERARVLIARLMLQPADVLILDEPTNDLDIPTLEILEESLLEFPGALVLVTHDRYLLDRVTNAVLGLDGRGNASALRRLPPMGKLARPAGTSGFKHQRKGRAAPGPSRIFLELAESSLIWNSANMTLWKSGSMRPMRASARPSSKSRMPRLSSIPKPSRRPSLNSKRQEPSTMPSTSAG